MTLDNKEIKKTRRGGIKFKERRLALKKAKKLALATINRKTKTRYPRGSKQTDINGTKRISDGGIRKIHVPPNRMSPLKKSWEQIVITVVEKLGLEIRMNTLSKCIEIRKPSQAIKDTNSKHSKDDMVLDHESIKENSCTSQENENLLQKACDYVKAFVIGYNLNDAEAILRLEDIFLETFQIQDVKRLSGDHLSRCIGRLSGRDGRTKYAIENATRTRIVIAGSSIHILGSFNCIAMARRSVCSLILGTPPSKVYNQLRTISKRLKERL